MLIAFSALSSKSAGVDRSLSLIATGAAVAVAATLAVDYRGLRFDLTTRNPKRRPHWLAVRLEEGPFRRFEGDWNVSELGQDACKIEFALKYEFDNTLVGKLAEGIFARIADTMVDAFARRAGDVRFGASGAHQPPLDLGARS